MSALIADTKGPFSGYEVNKEPMLGVLEKHLQAGERAYNESILGGMNDEPLQNAARQVWHETLDLAQKYGVRNSQISVLAPTGTIAFLMDCATTGVEPDIALVKYKKLVGGGTLKLVNNQVPMALRRLGYSNQETEAIIAHITEHDTIEGAPGLKENHLPVFDCAFKAANGERSISHMGHLKMMAAVQPFISGAISKTINLPNTATVEDVKDVFMQGWKLGLKAIALYRDGCKTIQPLNVTKNADTTAVKAEETVVDPLIEKSNGYTRRKLPDERPSMTHRFDIGGHKGYLNVGFYPDTMKPGETFITIAKEGSAVSGLLDTIATLISVCLQSGVPLKVLVKRFKDMRFEPSGFTTNENIPTAKSIVDYVFRYLGMKYLSREDKEDIFGPEAAASMPDFQHVLNGKTHVAADSALVDLAAKMTGETVEAPGPQHHAPGMVGRSSADAPVCQCGTLMVRAGACYSCPNCFATTGVCN